MSIISGPKSGKSSRSSRSNGAKITAPNGSVISRHPDDDSIITTSKKSGGNSRSSTMQGSILSHTQSVSQGKRSTISTTTTGVKSLSSGKISNKQESIATQSKTSSSKKSLNFKDSSMSRTGSSSSLKSSEFHGSIVSQAKSENFTYRSGKPGSVLSGVSSQVARRKKLKEVNADSNSLKERAMSVTSLNRRISNDSIALGSQLKRHSQSDVSIAIKSEILSMKKEERDKLLKIIDRYKEQETIDKSRKNAIDLKIREIRSLRPPYSEFQSDICYICQKRFWPIIFVKYSCHRCRIFVCKNCLRPYKTNTVCIQCFEEMKYLTKSDLLLKKFNFDDSDSDENIDVGTIKKIIRQTEKTEEINAYYMLENLDERDGTPRPSVTSSKFKSLLYRRKEESIISSKLKTQSSKSNSVLSLPESIKLSRKSSLISMKSTNAEAVNVQPDDTVSSGLIQGEIMIGLSYNFNSAEFQVIVKKCRDLDVANPNQKSSNPYVKVTLTPPIVNEKTHKTKVIQANLYPEFNERCKYKDVKYDDIIARSVLISVWHYEWLAKDIFLGQVFLKLNNYALDDASPQWHKLKDKGPVTIHPILSKYYGEIIFSIKYYSGDEEASSINQTEDNSEFSNTTGKITIWVKQANNLLTSKYSSLPNAYFKCLLLPKEAKQDHQKSQIIRKNFCPSWDITCTFNHIYPEELPYLGLEITIWDKRSGLLSDIFLGGVSLNFARNNREVPVPEKDVWEKMMSNKDQWIEAKLQLRKDLK